MPLHFIVLFKDYCLLSIAKDSINFAEPNNTVIVVADAINNSMPNITIIKAIDTIEAFIVSNAIAKVDSIAAVAKVDSIIVTTKVVASTTDVITSITEVVASNIAIMARVVIEATVDVGNRHQDPGLMSSAAFPAFKGSTDTVII